MSALPARGGAERRWLRDFPLPVGWRAQARTDRMAP